MPLSVVLFDLDDTLFEHRHAVDTGVTAHRRATGMPGDDTAEISRWHALEEEQYHRYLAGELDFLGQRRARARAFVEPYGTDLGQDAAAEDWFERYAREYERAWRLHTDALPCLDELDTLGARIGIITNGDIDFQTRKIAALGIAGRVEHLVASGELGFAKPDARIFDHACALFGVPPEAALYVGDRLATDAVGAQQAGLTGVWLNRSGVTSPEEDAVIEASGVRVIKTLIELSHIYQVSRR